MNLIRTHAGFYITKSIRIGQTEFVIGRRQRKPTEYVSWHVLGPDNYQNGRYFTESEPSTNIISAYQSLFQRALDHYKTELANKGVAPFTCEDIGVLERLVNTLQRYISDHPEIRRVSIALDNDAAGQKAALELQRKLLSLYRDRHIIVGTVSPIFKDWNEDLLKYRGCSIPVNEFLAMTAAELENAPDEREQQECFM